ncbi:MAG: ABC transporter permease [Eubacteriales bacterium]|nr:ABC transporter permease [Eubacteriales bacterium]
MRKVKKNIIGFFYNNMAVLYFLIIVVFAVCFLPNFLNVNNINALIRQAPVPIIRALAVAFILVLGNVDLSLGYIVGFVSISTGMMLNAGMPPAAVILAAILIGVAFGMFNGILVAAMNVPSFIVTLGSGYITYGLGLIISGGKQYSNLGKDFQAFGKTKILGYPLAVYYGLILVVIVWIVFRKTRYGRTLLAMGQNKEAARLAGLNTKAALLTSFMIAAGLAAFSGVLLTIRANVAQQSLGGVGEYTFEGVTACVLGGTSLAGGKLHVSGTFFAALTILIIENVITILGINRYFYQPVLGIIILIAVLIDSAKEKRSH